VLTSTDIPPGGEGKIEVTFDTSHKRGQQKKSITVESNDPRTPQATLYVSAVIEILLGFDQYVLDLGRIVKGQPAALTTTLLVKDPSLGNAVTFVSSSPHIAAALLDAPGRSSSDSGRLKIEVTASPEMPAGKINATLTARAPNAPDATVQVQGNVIGNFEVSPDMIQFHVDTSKGDLTPEAQVVKVTSLSGEALWIIRVDDVNQKLQIHVDTLLAGKQYEIALKPRPAVIDSKQNVGGRIAITTDDKEQPEIAVNYFVTFGR
jgi:hypothetical protein